MREVAGAESEQDRAWVQATLARALDKVGRIRTRVGATFPHVSTNGRWDARSPEWWTAGFWPGILWLAFQERDESAYSDLAGRLEERLDEALHGYIGLHHDVGFMWMPSAVSRFRRTGHRESYVRGLHAATLLAGRFNPAGNFLRSWGQDRSDPKTVGQVIVDSLMNLSILYWASLVTDDPAFAQIATRHADTVLANMVRPDGSSHHILVFDPETGEVIQALGGQGYAPESTWSRGNAWALYGLALVHAYTGEQRFLEGAERVAHYFLSHLPEDSVPYWDFRLPQWAGEPRDASAAAIAASGLMELARLADHPSERGFYRDAAFKLVRALTNGYVSFGDDEEGIVLHGTGNRPTGVAVDLPLIYGDFFFIEALVKLKGEPGIFVVETFPEAQ